ncbi:MAG: GNAT family N-acetyltransferase [Kiritimatiellae bacterium]|jgi:ribosomal protein S18 acetylase RimI-like enzyme|nr:GNAT family N-acetyltransferase [Kiritimatiellia bacterium]
MTDISDAPSTLQTAYSHRILRPSDATALMRIRHQAIQECPWNFGTPPGVELGKGSGYYRRQILHYKLRGTAAILGAWRGRDLVGIAGARIQRQHPTPCGLIFSMYVLPSHRGYGQGRSLLEQARMYLQEQFHVFCCQMNVEVNNTAALRLYESCGFHICGRENAAFRIHGQSYDVYLLEWQ